MMGEGMTQRKQGIKDMECGTGPCPYHPFHLLTLADTIPRTQEPSIFYFCITF